jgi:hypothetical protein
VALVTVQIHLALGIQRAILAGYDWAGAPPA